MNTKYKKEKGEKGEILVGENYQNQGYMLVEKNYTIPGGELDLIFQKNNILTFVEVKVIDHIDELQDYVTQKKLGHVKHTINYYLLTHPTDKEYTLDVVFVRDNSIFEVYKNVTNS
ncbi:MAG: YraN family protein [candidate division SR1 bacterium]|nr:YraN family protein [candidate division SR1 bacterium]